MSHNRMSSLLELNIDSSAAAALGHEYAARFTVLPIKREDGRLFVAMSEPFDVQVLRNLADITNMYITPIAASETDIRFHINRIFGEVAIHSIASQFLVDEKLKARAIPSDPALLAQISAAPAVRLIDSLIETGVLTRASDIHIEPYGRHLRARYRVDGELIIFGHVDLLLLPNVISRLKIMGDMDIAERRLPQDGHFSMTILDVAVEFRLSTIPTICGEKAVIRLLYNQSAQLKKDELGLFDDDLAAITRLFSQPYGAVFMTGPTGSGKSTTLSSFLEELNDGRTNIVTVEDPVERPLPGVNHINIEPAAGLGFATALKHILRQDPDVIMIGEIRDEETARIAIQAAITGHLVLSTLHTNDAAGIIERLTDMGIEPYLTAAALNGVISQRLVRRVCEDCAKEAVLTPRDATFLGTKVGLPIRDAVGCKHCNETGYHGRIAVYEYFVMDESLRRAMITDPAAFARNVRTGQSLRANALRHLAAGHTTVQEVLRVLSRDMPNEMM